MSVRLGANYALHRIHAGPLPITRSIAMPSSQRSSSADTRSAKRPLWPCLKLGRDGPRCTRVNSEEP